MYIYFVRHGQSLGNVNFVAGVPRPKTDPLTELGLIQAKDAANYILTQKIRPQKIISSPYTRTVDTAIIIQKALNVALEQDERLGEYDPGDWDGLHVDKFTEKFNDIAPEERYIFRPPNGETWLEEANRMNSVVRQAEDSGQTCLVIVSHFDPIKAIINLLTERPPTAWVTPVEYPPGSVTRLRKSHSGWSLV